MNPDSLLACGVLWRKMADPEAGWDLVDGLKSRDPEVRVLAHTLLVEGGDSSMELLESALALGIVDPDVAGPCLAEMLRIRQAKPVKGQRTLKHGVDAVLHWEVTHPN